MINNSMAIGDSPYSTGFATGKINYELNPAGQMKRYKTEEKETYEAPRTLPYEMGNLPQYFGNIVDNAIQASKNLENVLKEEDLDNRKDLEKLKINTDKIIMYLVENVDNILDKFTIGAKNNADDDE